MLGPPADHILRDGERGSAGDQLTADTETTVCIEHRKAPTTEAQLR